MSKLFYVNDRVRNKEYYTINNGMVHDSEMRFFNDVTGEEIWEPIHNKTVIAGSALIAMKLFGLSRTSLDATPTYNDVLELDSSASSNEYPTKYVADNDGNEFQIEDESQRVIAGFTLGVGGAGLDTSSVFEVPYTSWIKPEDLVPFRFPLTADDDVNENIYTGKKTITDGDLAGRTAYYIKRFSNGSGPNLEQKYIANVGVMDNIVSKNTVYITRTNDALSYVEMHCKINLEDIREYFIATTGSENARINQLQLVYGWDKTVSVTKDVNGNIISGDYQYLQHVRPFSLANIPNEIFSSPDKSMSIIYTLFF